MKEFVGSLTTPRGRFALVAARFNAFIVDHLVAGAADGLRRHGVSDHDIDLIRVPGSLEIPLVAHRLAETGEYAAIIALGAVIRGETFHFDIVAGESAKGLASASLLTGVPMIDAILTTDTIEQAVNRAGAKAGNKGFEAAVTAVEMVNLLENLPQSNKDE